MAIPIRIQRQRTKGFNLQTHSRLRNQLPCVTVSRPSKFGNPFTVEQYYDAGYNGDLNTAAQHCVDAYRAWLTGEKHWAHGELKPVPDLTELRGKNLACWCKDDAPCHADVLLELANKIETL